MEVVSDEELLYRRILFQTNQSPFYTRHTDGAVQLSASAFGDRNRRISVDRARLNGGDPTRTQSSLNDGVVSIVAQQVRAETIIANDERGKPVAQHMLDVVPAPIPDNPAHAEIIAHPDFTSKSAFERLKQMLARLAVWEIYPIDCRQEAS